MTASQTITRRAELACQLHELRRIQTRRTEPAMTDQRSHHRTRCRQARGSLSDYGSSDAASVEVPLATVDRTWRARTIGTADRLPIATTSGPTSGLSRLGMARPMTDLPTLDMLPAATYPNVAVGELSRTLSETLRKLGVGATVVQCVAGPSTVSFEIEPKDGVQMREFTKNGRAQDLACALGAETVRIQAPIPGKHRVGVEIPSPERRTVELSEIAQVARPPLVAGLGHHTRARTANARPRRVAAPDRCRRIRLRQVIATPRDALLAPDEVQARSARARSRRYEASRDDAVPRATAPASSRHRRSRRGDRRAR